MRLGCALGLAALMSGCGGPLSTLDPAGRSAAIIAALWWVLLAGATAIFVGVLAAAVFALRPERPGRGLSERAMLVGGGVVFPVAVLLALTVAALLVGERLRLDEEGEPLRVEVVAERWGWTFAYPDRPDLAPVEGVLTVPAGQPFEAVVTSRDVIHSFWVPRLGGKVDAIPGHVNTIRLQADAPGTYAGRCAEYCGIGHAGMGFEVRALAPEAFEAALAEAAR